MKKETYLDRKPMHVSDEAWEQAKVFAEHSYSWLDIAAYYSFVGIPLLKVLQKNRAWAFSRGWDSKERSSRDIEKGES